MEESNKVNKTVKKQKIIFWIIGFFAITGVILAALGACVIIVDPFFHYHAPNTGTYYYELNNEREQNNGILRHFDYDAVIIGTSMDENFKTSEFDAIFDVHSVKVTLSGAAYKETGDLLRSALTYNRNLKTVVRSLDMSCFFDDSDTVYYGKDKLEDCLTDNNPLNDYRYLLNASVLFDRVFPMIGEAGSKNARTGITDFDTASNWMKWRVGVFGSQEILSEPLENYSPAASELTDEEKIMIRRNITENITDIADEYPDVDFYYYITPYSAVWWNANMAGGVLISQVQAEQYIIELLLEHENIHLYSFNTNTSLTTNLNNYTDMGHYGEWVNSAILTWMDEGTGLLTEENYLEYIREEYEFYSDFDYTVLNDQTDYENDEDAAATIYGITFDAEVLKEQKMMNAEYAEDLYEGKPGFVCSGCLQRDPGSDFTYEEFLYQKEYSGIRIEVDDIFPYATLSFTGKKNGGHGMPTVVVYDEDGNVLTELITYYSAIEEDEWTEFSLDLAEFSGPVTIIMNGAYIDTSGSADSSFTFSNIMLR